MSDTQFSRDLRYRPSLAGFLQYRRDPLFVSVVTFEAAFDHSLIAGNRSVTIESLCGSVDFQPEVMHAVIELS